MSQYFSVMDKLMGPKPTIELFYKSRKFITHKKCITFLTGPKMWTSSSWGKWGWVADPCPARLLTFTPSCWCLAWSPAAGMCFCRFGAFQGWTWKSHRKIFAIFSWGWSRGWTLSISSLSSPGSTRSHPTDLVSLPTCLEFHPKIPHYSNPQFSSPSQTDLWDSTDSN